MLCSRNKNIQHLTCSLVKQRAAASEECNTELLSWKLHICSENNFPTAAGLASSAAGYACLGKIQLFKQLQLILCCLFSIHS